MKALILAAGYGTRLYPITKYYPKPLLSISGKPVIEYILDKLNNLDMIDEILLVTNNKFIGKFRDWNKHISSLKPIILINDRTRTYPTRLGALGDINFVIKKLGLKDNLMVIGGDNLFDEDLNGFTSFIKKHRANSVVGVYDVKSKSRAKQYGVVSIDRKKRIIDFEEKPLKPKSSLAAMCLYYFPKHKLFLFKEYLKAKGKDHDAAGSFIGWLHKKDRVLAFVFRGHWYDIGGHEFYEKAQQVFRIKK